MPQQQTTKEQELDPKEAHHEFVIAGFCEFLIEHHGSVMKAWRRSLDPNSEGELFFSEFVEALARVGWHGDTSALWSGLVRRALANDGDAALGLREIAPEDHVLVEAFRSWTVSRFGGAIEMFKTLSDNRPNASIHFEEFQDACRQYGFTGDVEFVFHRALDLDGEGAIMVRDMAFLEVDALKRKAALDPGFVMGLEAAKASAKRQRRRMRVQRKVQQDALKEFRLKVRAASGGSFIRGWRRILDISGNLAVSKIELLKGCKKIAFNGDVVALWKAMDIDDDGVVHLQEVDVRFALVLATFKKWSGDKYGSCVACLGQLQAMTRKRAPKWNVMDFAEGLRSANFPAVPGVLNSQVAAAMLHEALDMNDVGTITSADVSFLDKWEPTPWLCADPDFKEKDRFIAALRSRYANLIVGWRRLLDRSNTNRVAYKDFSDACRLLRFQNVPGIWRALDEDTSGFISLREIDQDSADALLHFKDWAEATFGTIQRAFRSVDTTRSNSLSFPVFKRGLRDFGFKGDARLLFQSLKPDANGRQGGRDARLTLEDLKYMSSWEVADQQERSEGDEDADEQSLSPASNASPNPHSKSQSRLRQSEAQAVSTESPNLKLPKKCPPAEGCQISSRMSDQFFFCRSAAEFKFYKMSRTDGSAMRSAFSVGDLLLPSVNVEKPANTDRAPNPSPYQAAIFSNSRQQEKKLQATVSLPSLSPSANPNSKSAGGGARSNTEPLPSLPAVHPTLA